MKRPTIEWKEISVPVDGCVEWTALDDEWSMTVRGSSNGVGSFGCRVVTTGFHRSFTVDSDAVGKVICEYVINGIWLSKTRDDSDSLKADIVRMMRENSGDGSLIWQGLGNFMKDRTAKIRMCADRIAELEEAAGLLMMANGSQADPDVVDTLQRANAELTAENAELMTRPEDSDVNSWKRAYERLEGENSKLEESLACSVREVAGLKGMLTTSSESQTRQEGVIDGLREAVGIAMVTLSERRG